MRITSTQPDDSEVLNQHSRAVSRVKSTSVPPAAPIVAQCFLDVIQELVWSAYARFLGEGIVGLYGQDQHIQGVDRIRGRYDFANSSTRAARWDSGCWTEAAQILGGQCEVLTMEQRHEQWPLGTRVSVVWVEPTRDDPLGRHRFGRVVKHHRTDEEPYACTVHFNNTITEQFGKEPPPSPFVVSLLNPYDAIVPFYALRKVVRAHALHRLHEMVEMGDTSREGEVVDAEFWGVPEVKRVHRRIVTPSGPRQPGQFFRGDRVYVDGAPTWTYTLFSELPPVGTMAHWRAIADHDSMPVDLVASSMRLLDPQPDCS